MLKTHIIMLLFVFFLSHGNYKKNAMNGVAIRVSELILCVAKAIPCTIIFRLVGTSQLKKLNFKRYNSLYFHTYSIYSIFLRCGLHPVTSLTKCKDYYTHIFQARCECCSENLGRGPSWPSGDRGKVEIGGYEGNIRIIGEYKPNMI